MESKFLPTKVFLLSRIKRLRELSVYYQEAGISPAIQNAFKRTDDEGQEVLFDAIVQLDVDFKLRHRIEKFLRSNETLLNGVACEKPEEYCDLLSVIDFFEMGRIEIMDRLDREA